jgi:hypothetical protein
MVHRPFALIGIGALQSLSPGQRGHTTTQPSSIEEEGFMWAASARRERLRQQAPTTGFNI